MKNLFLIIFLAFAISFSFAQGNWGNVDQNKDGRIDKSEWKAPLKLFKYFDKNKDSFITQDELLQSRDKEDEIYFKFHIKSKSELKKISKVISIEKVTGNEVTAYASETEFHSFMKRGRNFEILSPPGQQYSPSMALDTKDMKQWDKYPTYEVYVEIMKQFAKDYPNLCIIKNIGYSVEGREILFAKISDNVNKEEAEPEFMYTSTMHGDETTGFILMLRLIDYLLSNYGKDPQVTKLVNNVEIWINPLSNPDGTYNRGNSSVFGATRSNANRVDLNRNYANPDSGDHPDHKAWQPETVAMMEFAKENNFILSANHHGGAEVINYPWDTWKARHVADKWFQKVSHKYADSAQENSPSGYMSSHNDGITNGYDWYEVEGSRQDYMNYFHGCLEITTELSGRKLLEESKLPAHWDYNKKALLGFIEDSLNGIRGVVTDGTGKVLQAKVKVLNYDADYSIVKTDPDCGDFHKLILPGSYDIEISAYGYVAKTVKGVKVPQSGFTVVNAALKKASTISLKGRVTDVKTGKPLADAIVKILNTPVPEVKTDYNGNYELENVLEGSYSVEVSKSGYSTSSKKLTVSVENNTVNFALYGVIVQDFEDKIFPDYFKFSGTKWVIDNTAKNGVYSAKSGDISDNKYSEMTVTLDVIDESQITFYKKVSSENGYDFLKFYIDNQEKGKWSGNSDWSKESFAVTKGNHIFKWEYKKDSSTSSGSDAAWIDDISFPPSE